MRETALHTDDVPPRTDLSGTGIAPVRGTRSLWPSAGRRSAAPEAGSLPAARPRPRGSVELTSEARPRRRHRPARAKVQVTRPCALVCDAPSFRTVQPMANRPRTPLRRAVEADRGSAPGPDPALERLRPLRRRARREGEGRHRGGRREAQGERGRAAPPEARPRPDPADGAAPAV